MEYLLKKGENFTELYNFLPYRANLSFRLPIKRSIGCTCSIICTLFIHTKRIPGSRSEDLFFGHIVHTNRYPKHRAQRDQISANMPIADCSMISSPIIHNIISRLKRTFSGGSRSKPGTWFSAILNSSCLNC